MEKVFANAHQFDIKTISLMVIIGRDGKIVRVCRGYGEEALGKIAHGLNEAIAALFEPNTAVGAEMKVNEAKQWFIRFRCPENDDR